MKWMAVAGRAQGAPALAAFIWWTNEPYAVYILNYTAC